MLRSFLLLFLFNFVTLVYYYRNRTNIVIIIVRPCLRLIFETAETFRERKSAPPPPGNPRIRRRVRFRGGRVAGGGDR